jgi:hypothetical protein
VPKRFTVGLACASKLRKLLAAETDRAGRGGAFALIALERVVAVPAATPLSPVCTAGGGGQQPSSVPPPITAAG